MLVNKFLEQLLTPYNDHISYAVNLSSLNESCCCRSQQCKNKVVE